ncbi:serine hydrolase domain-containing protein [Saccharopolyspora elongata]|uniref:Class C beta-lactamase-related serine hydrolase n=2 Tax=Saccharopolyspora TaxID=1835 RepID=A0A4R4ZFH2_9PSEU|nr:serine hydrolase [Saccharopolyspora elongata]TDD55212.1 class C beta-lactamase-related serine hydrolase [Saccharopolyspora elongata]
MHAADRPPVPVTFENWQAPELIRWSFQHLDEVGPAADISRGGGPAAELERSPRDLTGLDVALDDGSTRTVADIVGSSDTNGWMVLHRNRVVAEEYAGGMTPATRHLLMSVSKSLVSTVTGALVGRGLVDPEAPVAAYVPELTDSGYAGATVRHLLDMRSGVVFREDYLDPDSDVRHLDEAVGWVPRRSADSPASLKAFLPTLRQDRPHGGRFEYRSAETDVLGWVCEAAAGERFPRLASDLLWSRLGAEHDAFIAVDSEGTGMFDGGICTTLGDLARFGAMILADGTSLTGEQVVPAQWVADIFTGAPDAAEAFAAAADAHGLPGGAYRSKFWFPKAGGDVALCLGIHGQLVYLDRANDVVGVKLSSWPAPLERWKHLASLRMFEAISAHLADGT